MDLLHGLPGPQAQPGVAARRRQAVGGLAGLVAALAYSSFLLAGPLGSTLNPMNSYVSELGAPTQPAATFFRGTDVVAGCLIVVLAVALRGSLPRDWRRVVGTTALGLAGASSVFDGWKPIECTPSIDRACRLREDATGLSLAELPLTTADPGVGLIERIFVLCASTWIAALALLLLHEVVGFPQAWWRARASG